MYPSRVDEYGGVFPTHKHYRKRDTTAITSPDNVYFYQFHAFEKKFRFNLKPSKDFVSPSFIVQRFSGNTTWIEEVDVRGGVLCFFSGRVDGEEESRVALSICDGLVSSHLSLSNYGLILYNAIFEPMVCDTPPVLYTIQLCIAN